jgi:hypothetical protein
VIDRKENVLLKQVWLCFFVHSQLRSVTPSHETGEVGGVTATAASKSQPRILPNKRRARVYLAHAQTLCRRRLRRTWQHSLSHDGLTLRLMNSSMRAGLQIKRSQQHFGHDPPSSSWDN